MSRVYWIGSIASAILSVLLLIAGLAAWRGDRLEAATGDGLTLDAESKFFGEAPARQKFPMKFTLRNRSSSPIHIIGADSVCTYSACLDAEGMPLTIPPRGAHELRVLVKTVRPGEFAGAITLYTDCPGRSLVSIKVEGRVTGDPDQP